MTRQSVDRDAPDVSDVAEAVGPVAPGPEVAETPRTPGVGESAARGVLWMTAQKWAIRLFGFVTILVLTRLLSPEEFGTVAAASTVLPFFYLLADLGFASYIVQAEKTDRRMLSTAFWFSMSAGIVLAGVLVAFAPLFGLAFANASVVPVIQALSIWVVITAVGSVPSALLRRDMRFGVLAGQGAVAALVAQVVALVLAFSGFGVWALVGQSLTAPVISTVLAWIAARWHPTWGFSRTDLRTMATFGGQVLGVEFVAMLRAWGEAAVISASLGIASLGFMSIAQRLVQIVQDLTGSAIVPVTNVAFAKIRSDAARLRDAYLRALRLTYAALSLPLTIVAVAAPLLVPILFGDGWVRSIPVAQILALAGTLSIGAWLDHGMFYGLGKPGAWFVYAVITDAVTFLTTLFLVREGLVAVAWGFLVVAAVATMARWFLVARQLHAPVLIVARPAGYLVTVVVTAGAAGFGMSLLTASWSPWLSLLAIAGTVAVVHLGITALIARDVLRDISRIVGRSRWAARMPSLSRWGNR